MTRWRGATDATSPDRRKLQELSDDSGLGPSQEIQGSYHIPKLRFQRSRDVQRGMYVVAGVDYR